ncbi:MAG: STAS domain-containing protein [Deferribacteraceae bacterium]|nr:STAS domain-containing protein [Deferribacteraceae bacterium]
MEITKTQTTEKITFALSGKLDTATSPAFQETLIPAFGEVKEIALDFADLKYVTSAGLRVLLMGEKTAKAKGATLTIANVSKEILDVFEITGFSGILTIV